MDWYHDLQAVMPPPAGIHLAAPADWAPAEAALGLRLPVDFRRYAETWGAAYVGRFLFAAVPADPNPNVDLVGNAAYVGHALGTLRRHHPDSFTVPVCPEPGGFLANGRTDNGDFLGWMVIGPDPEAWPAAIWGDEDSAPEVFEGMGFGPMMLGIVTGTLRPQAFPEDLWERLPLAVEGD